jgi:cytochrome b
MLPMRVWDGPLRLFHWALVVVLAVSWASIELFNNLDLHMRAGQVLLTLLLFRLVWGIIGSETARFSHFLGSPFAAFSHLRHLHRREPDTQIGHNAAGGWMVLVMLVVLLAQVASGLVAVNEDSFVYGPLSHLVASEWGAWALAQHHRLFTVIQVMVALHILAIATYAVLKRHDLVRPMITGKKRLPAATRQPRMRSPWLALAILAGAALVVWLAMNLL